MKTADLLTAAFWLLFGLGLSWQGWQLGHGPLAEPGSGFLIVWLGAFMALVAAGKLVKTLRDGKHSEPIAALWAGARVSKVVLAVLVLMAYALILPSVGFLISTVLLLLVLFRGIDPLGWLAAVVAAVLGAGASYLLFKTVLGTQLPAGWLG